MTHHLVLWGGFRLEPSRLWKDSESTQSRYTAGMSDSIKQQRVAAEVARLERDLERRGAGLGV